ncbi:hypothetical protein [Lysinibacillus xylanilyticus]|uniref:hypothetical protein n=1 Tax=Lysinibacillus xylanilyticus TaxID=582475 RepID=UPI0037FF52EC
MSRLSQQDVGHEGVITGRDGFSLRSPFADPQGVAQSPLQSIYSHDIGLKKCHPSFEFYRLTFTFYHSTFNFFQRMSKHQLKEVLCAPKSKKDSYTKLCVNPFS